MMNIQVITQRYPIQQTNFTFLCFLTIRSRREGRRKMKYTWFSITGINYLFRQVQLSLLLLSHLGNDKRNKQHTIWKRNYNIWTMSITFLPLTYAKPKMQFKLKKRNYVSFWSLEIFFSVLINTCIFTAIAIAAKILPILRRRFHLI